MRPHPHLYEINTCVWLESVSRREGRNLSLAEVPDHDWDELATLGFDLVWLMGVWERSPLGRKMAQTDPHLFPLYEKALPGWHPDQVVGSPYSIRDYSPDPRIGSWSDLAAARQELNSRDMGLILDFIPNHTGLDHVWVDSHPEYYIQATVQELDENPSLYYSIERNGQQPLILARGRDPYFPPWKDLAQLNLFHPGARTALLSEIQKISQHCDGVRCDMAMLVLADVFAKTWNQFLANFPRPAREFWSESISASPDFIWLAEVYWGMEQRLQNLGFDFTYCKGFYDLLRDERPAAEMRAHFTAAAN
ncbi:MAG: alpha-amylase family glycosyl hydrolase, partial [Candidatus Acidiferrales bacterium]